MKALDLLKYPLLTVICGLLAACTLQETGAPAPDLQPYPPVVEHDGSLRIAALDYYIEDLNDPEELARLTRADLLVVGTWQFWERDLDLEVLRAANPDLRIVAYFRPKGIRKQWSLEPPSGTRRYSHDLYEAALPYLCRTTTGDTASDYPETYLYNFLDPRARAAMLEVFVHYQNTSGNRFDGIFWDYFAKQLWIAPGTEGVTGDPDMDGDGIAHWDDPDELEAFLRGQEAWADEMRAAMGEGFIQIANGVRATRDSVFAAKFDGMFYEQFPNLGFNGADEFRMAMDPNEFNNLFAARNWVRTRNGGPWLILSQMYSPGLYMDENGEYVQLDADDMTRAVALLTDCAAITYRGSGERDAGLPEVEYALGPALGGLTIVGDTYSREFQNGRIVLQMRTGAYPIPFDFEVSQEGRVIHQSEYPAYEP